MNSAASLAPCLVAFPRRAERARTRKGCDLCGTSIGDSHVHLVDPTARRQFCACPVCATLADGEHARFTRVPETADPMTGWEWRIVEARPGLAVIEVGGLVLRVGDRVELRPRGGADSLQLALTGRAATIDAIEEDVGGRHCLAVVLEDAPGRDLGWARQPGHRFFFSPTEVVALDPRPVPGEKPVADGGRRVLVAGVGNVFCGDDGFGAEVAQRLLTRDLPAGVRVVDFGIRGFDLACALNTVDAAILVDAFPHGKPPGDLLVVEPDVESAGAIGMPEGAGPHGLDPTSVFRLARKMRTLPPRLLLVGCEPDTVGGPDGAMGLSPAVQAAVDNAVCLVETLATDLING